MDDKRLIDANALPMHKVKIVHAFGIVEGCVVFPDSIAKAPTIDAVEVVRCGRCIHYDTDCEYCAYLEDDRGPYDYCSRGI